MTEIVDTYQYIVGNDNISIISTLLVLIDLAIKILFLYVAFLIIKVSHIYINKNKKANDETVINS